MRKVFNLLVIAAVIAAFAFPAFAQVKCPHKDKMVHKDPCPMVKELKLTEKQQAEFNKIKEGCMVSNKDFHAKLAKLAEEKGKLMAAEKPDKKAIDAVIDEMAKIGAEVKKICVDCKLKTRALLTPEQLKKFDEMKEKCCKHEASCNHKCCSHDKKEQQPPKEPAKDCTKSTTGCSQDCIHK